MRAILTLTILLLLYINQSVAVNTTERQRIVFSGQPDTIPVLPASFTDDYKIRYTINDSMWIQHPNAQYHILKWNKEERYIILRNHANNKWDQGLYSRIDYVPLQNMTPYTWAYCLSTYNAKSDSLAEFAPTKTDPSNPRKGCNGYPFSRMKVE